MGAVVTAGTADTLVLVLFCRPSWRSSAWKFCLPGGLTATLDVSADVRVRLSVAEDSCLISGARGHVGRASLERTVEWLIAQRIGRDDLVLALGGGVIGDLAGFAAAVLRRGVGFVQVPTTLLAQVDSLVGGKTGINSPQGKNLVGAFHPPAAVVVDPGVLVTLPAADLLAGAAESVKHGVIADTAYFQAVADLLPSLAGGAPATPAGDRSGWLASLQEVVARSVAIKASVVAHDEREGGMRKILNFGHTVGHALEAIAGPRKLLHGEAVALGMMAAAEIGVNLGVTPVAVAERLIAGILSFGSLPLVPVNVAQAMSRIAMDKKSRDGRARFVLLEAVGSAVVREVPAKLVRDAVRSVIA